MCLDHLCVSEKAKYFCSFRDYVVHLVTIRGNTILKDFIVDNVLANLLALT